MTGTARLLRFEEAVDLSSFDETTRSEIQALLNYVREMVNGIHDVDVVSWAIDRSLLGRTALSLTLAAPVWEWERLSIRVWKHDDNEQIHCETIDS